MNLYCVKPYGMPGGLVVVAKSEESALTLIRFKTAGKPDRGGVYQHGVEPFLEAHYMGLAKVDGPERILCVLKGLVDFKLNGGTMPSSAEDVSTWRIAVPVFLPKTTRPRRGPSTASAPPATARKRPQTT